MNIDRCQETIFRLGFRESAWKPLKSYVDFLWKSNEDLNLVSRKMTEQDLLDNHVLDCLLPLPYFPKNLKRVADLGSGGGLPGVLYALQFPDVEFHLFEKSPKKREFLTSCRDFAPNLHIQGEIPQKFQGFDLVTARGFKPLDVILDMTRSYYGSGGSYFLLKARREKIEEEISLAKKKFKDLKVEITQLKSPVLEVERHLVRIEGASLENDSRKILKS